MLYKYNTKIFVILHDLEINAKEKRSTHPQCGYNSQKSIHIWAYHACGTVRQSELSAS